MRRVLALSLLLLAAGCGYHLTAGGGPLPGGARTLFVPVFKNATAEPGMEGLFTDALREELSRWGREGGEASDAAIEGTITSVVGSGAIFTSIGVTATYRVQATVALRVIKDGQKIAETVVAGSEDYLPQRPCTGADCVAASSPRVVYPDPKSPTTSYPHTDTTVLEMEANRRLALRRLAQTLMRQAYQNLTGF